MHDLPALPDAAPPYSEIDPKAEESRRHSTVIQSPEGWTGTLDWIWTTQPAWIVLAPELPGVWSTRSLRGGVLAWRVHW